MSFLWSPCPDDLRATEKEVSCDFWGYCRGRQIEIAKRLIGGRRLGHGYRFASEHALIDNAVTTKEETVRGKLAQARIADLINVTRDEIAGGNVPP